MIRKRRQAIRTGVQPLNKGVWRYLNNSNVFTAQIDWHPGDDLYPKTTNLNGQQPNGAAMPSSPRTPHAPPPPNKRPPLPPLSKERLRIIIRELFDTEHHYFSDLALITEHLQKYKNKGIQINRQNNIRIIQSDIGTFNNVFE